MKLRKGLEDHGRLIAEKANKKRTERGRKRRVTEREFLARMVHEFEKDPKVMEKLMEKLLLKACAADKDALAFIGKYLMGGGKVSLDDVYHAPMIRKTRS